MGRSPRNAVLVLAAALLLAWLAPTAAEAQRGPRSKHRVRWKAPVRAERARPRLHRPAKAKTRLGRARQRPLNNGKTALGTKRGGDRGRLQANIRKVLQLYRRSKASTGTIRKADLVNRHGITNDNQISLLVDGKEAFRSMFGAIDKATDTIHVSFYIFNNDHMGNAFANKLIGKAKQGVKVKMMVDGIGSVQMLGSPKRKIINKLAKNGVEIIRNHVFNPLSKARKVNNPDHRKLVIIDGKVAFTGGMNVGNHYLKGYHDLMVRVEGSAVHQMQAEWMTSWLHLGGRFDGVKASEAGLRERFFPAVVKKPGKQQARVAQMIPGRNTEILATYLRQINSAKKSILIENPYLTNHQVQDALVAAAKRGAKVQIVLPSNSDHGFSHLAARARYPAMLKAGVKIYEYPGFNHGKVMVTDGKFVTIGSSNLDDVALHHIYELNVNVHDRKFAREVTKRVFQKDIPISKPMKASDITPMQRATGAFWNLFAHFI